MSRLHQAVTIGRDDYTKDTQKQLHKTDYSAGVLHGGHQNKIHKILLTLRRGHLTNTQAILCMSVKVTIVTSDDSVKFKCKQTSLLRTLIIIQHKDDHTPKPAPKGLLKPQA